MGNAVRRISMTASRKTKTIVATFAFWICVCFVVFAAAAVDGGEPQGGFPVELPGAAVAPTSPTVADLDNDGTLEVLLGLWSTEADLAVYRFDGTAFPGWPILIPGYANGVRRAVMVADVDGDGAPEVVFEANVNGVPGYVSFYAMTSEAEIKPGWPIEVPDQSGIAYFALTDVDGDGADELITVSYGSMRIVRAYNGDGSLLWWVLLPVGYPGFWGTVENGAFAVGDLDFDGSSEIVVSFLLYQGPGIGTFAGGPVFVVNGDGTIRDGWPIDPPGSLGDSYVKGFAIADLDSDGTCEIIATNHYNVFILRPDGSSFLPAPSLSFSTVSSYDPPACADLDEDGDLEILVPGKELRIYDHETGEIASTSEEDNYEDYAGVSVGDVNGDGLCEIAVWTWDDLSLDTGIENVMHLLDSDLQELPGWPKPIPQNQGPLNWHVGTAMGDLDADGDVEIIHTSRTWLYVWDEPHPGESPLRIEWPMRAHDPHNGAFYHTGTIPHIMRGDGNGDGALDVADGVVALFYLFAGEQGIDCPAALDFNADLALNLADPIGLFTFLFQAGMPPGEPYPGCGPIPPTGGFACSRYECP
ncbi:MAG: FG-GAP repeat domain-containing protein [Planctomycetota bacterium]